MLLEISGEITPERMKGWGQSKTTPSRGCDIIEAKFDAAKGNTAQEPGVSGP